eukprot:1137096-Pelagomonas_calceolata.AAC.1
METRPRGLQMSRLDDLAQCSKLANYPLKSRLEVSRLDWGSFAPVTSVTSLNHPLRSKGRAMHPRSAH